MSNRDVAKRTAEVIYAFTQHLARPGEGIQCHDAVEYVRRNGRGLRLHGELEFVVWDERKWDAMAAYIRENLKGAPNIRPFRELLEDIEDGSVNGHSYIRWRGFYIDPYFDYLGVDFKGIQRIGKWFDKAYKAIGGALREHIHITLAEVAQNTVFTRFTTPATTGDPRLCFENARQEYWAQKGLGRSPEYWDGTVVGYRPEDDPNGAPITLRHAWVVIDGLIADPTPFVVGNTVRSAHENWTTATRYEGKRRIEEGMLRQPLKSFVAVSEGKVPRWRAAEIMARAAEHEMNVDSGDERPLPGFQKMITLLDKARDGAGLTASEWDWFANYVEHTSPL